MRKIENITQLRQEYARLSALKTEQEELLKRDFNDILESLKPVNLLISLSKDLFARRNDRALLTSGLNLGLQLLANKLLSSKVGIMKSVLTYVGQSIASNLLASKSEGILDRIKGMFNFGKKKKTTIISEEEDVSHRYN